MISEVRLFNIKKWYHLPYPKHSVNQWIKTKNESNLFQENFEIYRKLVFGVPYVQRSNCNNFLNSIEHDADMSERYHFCDVIPTIDKNHFRIAFRVIVNSLTLIHEIGNFEQEYAWLLLVVCLQSTIRNTLILFYGFFFWILFCK